MGEGLPAVADRACVGAAAAVELLPRPLAAAVAAAAVAAAAVAAGQGRSASACPWLPALGRAALRLLAEAGAARGGRP